METTEKEIQKTETRHDVQIAVMANDMKHIAKTLDAMQNDIKNLGNSFVKTTEFEEWKKQEFNEVKKTVADHSDILIKHTISITRIMTYGVAIISIVGAVQLALSIYKTFK